MALPFLTFYKLPLASVTVATATGLMDALILSLNSATDYRGTAIPTSHRWTFNQIGATNGVYATPPSTSTMTVVPNLIWALGAAAGSSTFLTPDSFTANAPNIGIVTNPGAFSAWDSANPWASGRWSGYWRWGSAPYANVACRLRAYVSQEVVVTTMYTQQTAATVACAIGATVAPYSTTPDSADADGRLYGMWTTGGTAMTTFWTAAGGVLSHSTGATIEHLGTFQPKQSTFYTGGRDHLFTTALVSQQQDIGGTWIKREIGICRNTASLTPSGVALGVLRGTYMLGLGIAPQTLQNVGGTDAIHVVSGSQLIPQHAFGLQAAP